VSIPEENIIVYRTAQGELKWDLSKCSFLDLIELKKCGQSVNLKIYDEQRRGYIEYLQMKEADAVANKLKEKIISNSRSPSIWIKLLRKINKN
jgi:hypothetical protein